jgi:hypothetical protein
VPPVEEHHITETKATLLLFQWGPRGSVLALKKAQAWRRQRIPVVPDQSCQPLHQEKGRHAHTATDMPHVNICCVVTWRWCHASAVIVTALLPPCYVEARLTDVSASQHVAWHPWGWSPWFIWRGLRQRHKSFWTELYMVLVVSDFIIMVRISAWQTVFFSLIFLLEFRFLHYFAMSFHCTVWVSGYFVMRFAIDIYAVISFSH